jgi:hypothetical protein
MDDLDIDITVLIINKKTGAVYANRLCAPANDESLSLLIRRQMAALDRFLADRKIVDGGSFVLPPGWKLEASRLEPKGTT